eukprot:1176630-Prorocentrum_minimum.AAC.2
MTGGLRCNRRTVCRLSLAADIELTVNKITWKSQGGRHPSHDVYVQLTGFGTHGVLQTRTARAPFVWHQQFHSSMHANEMQYLVPVLFSVKVRSGPPLHPLYTPSTPREE